MHLGEKIEEILTVNGNARGIKTEGGQIVAADFILMSIGVVPNTELARDAGLQLGIKGAIAVNDEMQTSDPLYGPVGIVPDEKSNYGKPVYIPLGTTANKQGRIAGENVAGGHETFKGVLGSMVTKVFNLYIAATGLSLRQAEEAGMMQLAL